jgi:hypothetical protein
LIVEADKLTISGSGSGGGSGGAGGGGGYIARALVTANTLYATKTDTSIPVSYTCYSTAPGANIRATVLVGVGSNKKQVDYFPLVSQTEVNTINVADYITSLKLNAANTITI